MRDLGVIHIFMAGLISRPNPEVQEQEGGREREKEKEREREKSSFNLCMRVYIDVLMLNPLVSMTTCTFFALQNYKDYIRGVQQAWRNMENHNLM